MIHHNIAHALGYYFHAATNPEQLSVYLPKNTAIFATGNPGARSFLVHMRRQQPARTGYSRCCRTVSHRYQSSPNSDLHIRIKAEGWKRDKQLLEPGQVKNQTSLPMPRACHLHEAGKNKVNLSLPVPNRPDINMNIAETPKRSAQKPTGTNRRGSGLGSKSFLRRTTKGPQDQAHLAKRAVYRSDGSEDVRPER